MPTPSTTDRTGKGRRPTTPSQKQKQKGPSSVSCNDGIDGAKSKTAATRAEEDPRLKEIARRILQKFSANYQQQLHACTSSAEKRALDKKQLIASRNATARAADGFDHWWAWVEELDALNLLSPQDVQSLKRYMIFGRDQSTEEQHNRLPQVCALMEEQVGVYFESLAEKGCAAKGWANLQEMRDRFMLIKPRLVAQGFRDAVGLMQGMVEGMVLEGILSAAVGADITQYLLEGTAASAPLGTTAGQPVGAAASAPLGTTAGQPVSDAA